MGQTSSRMVRNRFPWLLAAVLCGSAALAQQAPSSGVTFRADVGNVLVQANVLDKHGRSVNNLPASDFTVYENGVRQKVDTFSHDDTPVSVGILVDDSGSMRPNVAAVDEAAMNFVRASNPQDEVFEVLFNDEYHLVSPFTNNVSKLELALGSLDPDAGTALYDTVIRAAAYLKRYGTRPKKVLLLITDGDDDASSHDLQQTLRIVQAQDAPLIYCIGLTDKGDGGFFSRQSHKVLLQFSEDTGGVAYFPKNLRQVDAITRKVARDIRLQYSLVYRSNQTQPGYHTIRLTVKDPKRKHLHAYTRRGFYLPAAAAQH
jgi:Ca-activated chloride channel family protein